MSDNPCESCPEDCSTERCTHCPDNPGNKKPTERVHLSIYPTVCAGRVAVQGSEQGLLIDLDDRKKK